MDKHWLWIVQVARMELKNSLFSHGPEKSLHTTDSPSKIMITEGCRFECQCVSFTRKLNNSSTRIVLFRHLFIVASNFDLSSAAASDRRTLTEDFSSLMKADSRQDKGGNISHVRNLILT